MSFVEIKLSVIREQVSYSRKLRKFNDFYFIIIFKARNTYFLQFTFNSKFV